MGETTKSQSSMMDCFGDPSNYNKPVKEIEVLLLCDI